MLLICCCVVEFAHAQIEWRQNGSSAIGDSTRFLFQANGFRSDYSNSVSREFIETAVFGGHIDEGLKRDVFQNLEDDNNYAGLLNASAYLTFFPALSKFGYTVGYEQSNYASVGFTQDLYQLAMYGNLGFGNAPADLSQTQEDYYNYDRFAFGMVHKKSGAFLSLGIYNGKNHIKYATDLLTVSTNYGNMNGFEYVESIAIEAENFESYESNKDDGLFNTGIGIGISGGHSFQLKKGYINIALKDLGAMYWKNVNKSDTSGTFQFEGISWNLGDDYDMRNILDALQDSLVPNPESVDIWKMLPGLVEATYYTESKGKWMASLGAKYQWGLSLLPELETAVYYDYGQNNILWASANFGGYYTATFGLGTEIEILENSRITLGSKYFLGLVYDDARALNAFVKYTLNI